MQIIKSYLKEFYEKTNFIMLPMDLRVCFKRAGLNNNL